MLPPFEVTWPVVAVVCVHAVRDVLLRYAERKRSDQEVAQDRRTGPDGPAQA